MDGMGVDAGTHPSTEVIDAQPRSSGRQDFRATEGFMTYVGNK
jgi:hypothetical protein